MRLRFEDCEIDLDRFELRRGGQLIPAQRRELDLLTYLIEHRDRVVSRDDMLQAVWHGDVVSDSALTKAVKGARRAVGDDGERQRIIQTVRGRGVRFVSRVVRVAPDAGGRARENPEGFVGREATLRLLEANLEHALNGQARLVSLTGDPGIGKTRTAHELAPLARARGARMVFARCHEGDGAPPFWPWRQVISGLVGDEPADTRRALLGASAPEAAALVPELRELVSGIPTAPAIDSTHARFRAFAAVAHVLRRASEGRPLVVLFDDAHWADHPSLGLLLFAAAELEHSPILWLVAYRDIEATVDAARADALAGINRQGGGAILPLAGLSPTEVACLVERRTGADPSPQIAERLRERTGGNPLFLLHVIDALGPSGVSSDGAEPRELPAAVQDTIRRQVASLPALTQKLLETAAAIGEDFSLGVLAASVGLDPASAAESLDSACLARIVEPVAERFGSYRFAHALVAETLYAGLSRSTGSDLHARIGAAIETVHAGDLGDHLAALAHHYLRAAPFSDPRIAVDFATRAARRAFAHFAYEQAALQYERAVQALSLGPADEALLLDLLQEQGVAYTRAGGVADAKRVFARAADIARGLGCADALARAAVGFACEGESTRPDRARIVLLEEGLRALGSRDCAIRSEVLGRLSEALYFADRQRRVALARESLAVARKIGDPATVAGTLSRLHLALSGAGTLGERRALSAELSELARSCVSRELGPSLRCALQDQLQGGDLAGADRSIAAYRRLASELREPRLEWYSAHDRVMRALLCGDLDGAEELVGEALQRGVRAGTEAAASYYGVQLFVLRREQGRLSELIPHVRELRERYPDTTGWVAALALFDAEEGRLDSARAGLEQLTADGLEQVKRDVNWLVTPCILAETCWHLRDAQRARLLYDQLEPNAGEQAVVALTMVVWGPVSRHLGQCAAAFGEPSRAERHLCTALEQAERMGAPAIAARVRADLERLTRVQTVPASRRDATSAVS